MYTYFYEPDDPALSASFDPVAKQRQWELDNNIEQSVLLRVSKHVYECEQIWDDKRIIRFKHSEGTHMLYVAFKSLLCAMNHDITELCNILSKDSGEYQRGIGYAVIFYMPDRKDGWSFWWYLSQENKYYKHYLPSNAQVLLGSDYARFDNNGQAKYVPIGNISSEEKRLLYTKGE